VDSLLQDSGAVTSFVVGAATLAGLLLISRSARHSDLRSCRSCGFDVRAMKDGERCPQCGAVLDAQNVLTPEGIFSRKSMIITGLSLCIPGSIVLMYLILTRLTF
jgi:hypothetical protein